MSDYSPPLDDIRLVLREISDIEGICELPGYEHVDVDTIDGMLEELNAIVHPIMYKEIEKRILSLRANGT